jgi:hypothetical protein
MDPEPVVREFSDLFPDPLEVEIPAVAPVGPKPEAVEPPSASARPLTVKLTITWSGSAFAGIGRLSDWKIVRLFLY